MPYRCLADFLEQLGQAGELARVDAEVNPLLEVSEITARIARQHGPALLFGTVKGHDIALLTNLLGTEERLCRALGVASLGEVAERIASRLAPSGREGWLERLSLGAAALSSLAPRRVKSASCQQVIRLGHDVDLRQLPAVQSAPHEAGPAISAAATLTAAPNAPQQVAGRYDLQIVGPDRLAVGWAAHDEPASILEEYRRRGEKMPLAAALGGDPAMLLAASALLPPRGDAYVLAGLLRGKPLEVVGARSVALQVPADAEMVLEGYVDPAEPPLTPGPLATPLGYYGLPRACPVWHVTAISHRANPIFPALAYGPAASEARVISGALARICLPFVQSAIPELVDYDLPAPGGARHVAILAIRKTYAGQARRAAATAWGLPQLMFAKLLVIVDEDVDVRDAGQVLSAVTGHADSRRDLLFQEGPPDTLDVARAPGRLGHKIALDATRKTPEEHGGPPPEAATMSDAIRQLVSERWPEYGLGPEKSA